MNSKKEEKDFIFITVIGGDKKGIVAKISRCLFENDINIEDISQKIMEGYFVMTMLADKKDANKSLEEVNKEIQKIAKELNLKIHVQHEDLFKMMHRV